MKLVSVPKESALGQVKGADSIFEIYTESYGNHPIVIQGAGAGASVTARGIFGDILRLVERDRNQKKKYYKKQTARKYMFQAICL